MPKVRLARRDRLRDQSWPSNHDRELASDAEPLLSNYSDSIDWVLCEFGACSASDLEPASTIIYIDRADPRKSTLSQAELVTTVSAIKPHHSQNKIDSEVSRLRALGFLPCLDDNQKLVASA